jgi:hypothetical protein
MLNAVATRGGDAYLSCPLRRAGSRAAAGLPDLGVAPSLVSYFFDGWEGLLLSAYRLLEKRALDEYRQIAKCWVRRGKGWTAHRAQCLAGLALRRGGGAYIALWDLSRTMPELKAEFTRFHRARRRIVSALFSELTGTRHRTADADLLAAGSSCSWTAMARTGLESAKSRPRDAVRMCRIWIDANFLSSRRAARR